MVCNPLFNPTVENVKADSTLSEKFGKENFVLFPVPFKSASK